MNNSHRHSNLLCGAIKQKPNFRIVPELDKRERARSLHLLSLNALSRLRIFYHTHRLKLPLNHTPKFAITHKHRTTITFAMATKWVPPHQRNTDAKLEIAAKWEPPHERNTRGQQTPKQQKGISLNPAIKEFKPSSTNCTSLSFEFHPRL